MNDSGIIFDESRSNAFIIHHDINALVYSYQSEEDCLLGWSLEFWDKELPDMIEKSVQKYKSQPVLDYYFSEISDRIKIDKKIYF